MDLREDYYRLLVRKLVQACPTPQRTQVSPWPHLTVGSWPSDKRVFSGFFRLCGFHHRIAAKTSSCVRNEDKWDKQIRQPSKDELSRSSFVGVLNTPGQGGLRGSRRRDSIANTAASSAGNREVVLCFVPVQNHFDGTPAPTNR